MDIRMAQGLWRNNRKDPRKLYARVLSAQMFGIREGDNCGLYLNTVVSDKREKMEFPGLIESVLPSRKFLMRVYRYIVFEPYYFVAYGDLVTTDHPSDVREVEENFESPWRTAITVVNEHLFSQVWDLDYINSISLTPNIFQGKTVTPYRRNDSDIVIDLELFRHFIRSYERALPLPREVLEALAEGTSCGF